MIGWIKNTLFPAQVRTDEPSNSSVKASLPTPEKRQGRRPLGHGRRSFPMGESKLTNSLSDWPTSPTSTIDSIVDQGPAMMYRARRLTSSDPYATRYLKLLENNVLGCDGFLFQSKIVKRNGRLDMKPNDYIEAKWKDWGKKQFASRNGTMSWYDICRTVLRTCAIDGGALVIRRRDAKPTNPYGFSLELRSHADLLWDNAARGVPDSTVGGIEYDDEGEPVAYWIKEREIPRRGGGFRRSSKYLRYPADQVQYVFLPNWIGQTHGPTWFYPVGVRMKLQNKFDDAAVTHAVVGACQMGFLIPESKPDDEELDDDEVIDTGEPEEDEPELDIEVRPGSYPQLPEGFTVKEVNPKFPNGNYGPFTQANVRGMAVGLGVSETALSGDLSRVNYSSIRAGVLEEREEWKRLQSWMIESFVSWVFEQWFDHQFLTGVFPWPIEKRDYLFQPSFVGRRWQNVDPLKDAAANQTLLSLRLTSRQRILAEQGIDLEELEAEINRDTNHPSGKPPVIPPEMLLDPVEPPPPSEDEPPPQEEEPDPPEPPQIKRR